MPFLLAARPHRRCATGQSSSAPHCRRCWLPPSGWRPPWRKACTAAAGSDRERPSGSSGNTSRAMPRAGQLVWVGDFLAPPEEINAAIAQFAGAGLKGHLVQIADPAEEELPFAGRVRFEGVEESDEIVISRVETLRDDYVQRFQRHREALAGMVRAVGWTLSFHRTDRPPQLALLALHAALTADRRR